MISTDSGVVGVWPLVYLCSLYDAGQRSLWLIDFSWQGETPFIWHARFPEPLMWLPR